MIPLDSPEGSRYAGLAWFAVAAFACLAAAALFSVGGPSNTSDPEKYLWLVRGGLICLVIAGMATWRMVRVRADSWLLPLAALNLLVLEPGRAGEAASWRLEWGAFGLVAMAVAVLLFARLLKETDELQRRTFVEGAATGLVFALPAAMVYALFEPQLPALRAQWVTIALLLLWWAGWMRAAWRYRQGGRA